MKLCRHAIPAVCAIALTGCVTIPMDGDLPYDGVKDNIDSGSTTRTDVLFALGEPNLARRDDTLFVYSGYELEGKLILVAAGVAKTACLRSALNANATSDPYGCVRLCVQSTA